MTRSIDHYHQNIILLILFLLIILLGGCEALQPRAQSRLSVDPASEIGADQPPTAKTYYAMARLLDAQQRYAEQHFVLRRCILKHPNFLPAYDAMASLHMRQGKIDDAINALSSGLIIAPNNASLANNLGICRLLTEEYEKALAQFEKISAQHPEKARYQSNRALALGLLGRYDDSLAAYQKVLNPAEAHYNLGVVCESRNDLARARIEFQRATQLGIKTDALTGAIATAGIERTKADSQASAGGDTPEPNRPDEIESTAALNQPSD